jgi:hypothetical protein
MASAAPTPAANDWRIVRRPTLDGADASGAAVRAMMSEGFSALIFGA